MVANPSLEYCQLMNFLPFSSLSLCKQFRFLFEARWLSQRLSLTSNFWQRGISGHVWTCLFWLSIVPIEWNNITLRVTPYDAYMNATLDDQATSFFWDFTSSHFLVVVVYVPVHPVITQLWMSKSATKFEKSAALCLVTHISKTRTLRNRRNETSMYGGRETIINYHNWKALILLKYCF